MTLHIGFWVVPALITIVGAIGVGSYRPSGMYDVGGAILSAIWFVASLVAWLMWGLSWLM